MSPIKRWGALVLAVVLLFSLATGCGKKAEDTKAKEEQPEAAAPEAGQQPPKDQNPVPVVNVDLGMKPSDVVAEYEGGKLTAEDFENYLRIQAFINPQAGLAIQQKDPQALKMFVDSYIAETAMANQAPEVKNVDDEAQKLLDRIKGQYQMVFGGDEKKLEKQMKDQGVTDQQLKDFFIRYKKVEAYLRSQVTDQELKNKYEEGKKQGAFVLATVRHILIGTGETSADKKRTDADAKKLAQEIADRLRKGEDFAKLAKQYSDDPGSKDNGGLYENVDVSQWVPEFKKAAIELPLNKISDPVKTDYGYHVMKVEKREEQSFDQVKEQIQAQFVNQKYDEFLNTKLKDMIKKVNLPEQPKK